MGERLKKAGEGFSGFCSKAVAAAVLLFMCYLLPMSFFRTTGMSTGGGVGEIVSFEYDNIFLNLITLTLGICMLYLLWRFFEKLRFRVVLAALFLWIMFWGLWLVVSAKLQPSEDSFIITYFARQAAKGDSSFYHEYFRFFPYQFGYALYCEGIFRLFYSVMPEAPDGFSSLVIQGLNVFYTAVACCSLVGMAARVFRSRSVARLSAAMLFFCMPAIYFVTYMYGNVPAFACSCAALWAYAAFYRDGKWYQGLLCLVLMPLAVLLKLNSLIIVVALLICSFVAFVKKPSVKMAVLALALAFAVSFASGLPQRHYEARTGEDFGDGIPMLSWLAMGLNEGESCSGWYNPTYTTTAFRLNDYDSAATGEIAVGAIRERLAYFASEPLEALHFFGRKFLSQWNEPSYQGLWNNQLREHYSQPGFFYEMSCHRFERLARAIMNIFQQLVFFGFTIGLVRIFRRRDMLLSLLPLIILGGMLYHLLFEAKSQHAQGYFLMMIPVAAYGFMKFFKFLRENKLSTSPQKAK